MNWEAASALAACLGDAIVIGALFVAFFQLKDGRRAMQFDATRKLIARSLDPEFYRALQFVFNDLHARLGDRAYAAELAASYGWNIDAERHPELVVLARLEEVGTYVKYRLVSEDALLDFLGELVIGSWERLTPVVEIMRGAHRNPNVWENAEFLDRTARSWLQRKRVPRVV
ncbi:MAG: hypothetical protein JO199_12975 [Candidatus Eremiobacteraeota bacterium]|nr:hypothetical protein [Candidatus Eremiobacteraeota bacterium]